MRKIHFGKTEEMTLIKNEITHTQLTSGKSTELPVNETLTKL